MAAWVLLTVVTVVSLITDLRDRKILNSVVVPAVVLGIGLNAWNNGTVGVVLGLEGFLVGLGIFFIPYLMGGIGAGDVKLMAAIGAIKGPVFAVWTGLGAGVAGGLIALVVLIRQKKLIAALRRIWFTLLLVAVGKRRESLECLDKQEYSASFPYGLAIALGVLAAGFLGITGPLFGMR